MVLAVCANPAIDRVYFVDEFIMGEVYRPTGIFVSAGGKGINVARVASILGADVCVTGFLGGHSGEYISSELKKMNIKDLFIRTDKETRTCVNISDKNGLSGEILESGECLDANDENNFLKEYERIVPGADVITVSGSQPKGLSKDFYIKLLDYAKAKNKKCIIDTSGETLKLVIDAKPFMVKPNRYEISQYLGCDVSTISECKEALAVLRDRGVQVPLCTLGADGALLYYEGKFIRFITPDVTVVNTVGSGDSTVAGIAFGISENMSVTDAVKYGMASGLTNALYKQTGFVDKKTVDEYFMQIKLEYV